MMEFPSLQAAVNVDEPGDCLSMMWMRTPHYDCRLLIVEVLVP